MTVPEQSEFIVRLVMKVDAQADQPWKAVSNFVDLLTSNGLRDWVYRVENIDSGEIVGYFDGYGEAVDIQTPVENEVTDVQLPAEQNPAEVQDDAALMALADSLNEDAPAVEG